MTKGTGFNVAPRSHPNQDSYMTPCILKKLSHPPQNVQYTKEPPTKTQ